MGVLIPTRTSRLA